MNRTTFDNENNPYRISVVGKKVQNMENMNQIQFLKLTA